VIDGRSDDGVASRPRVKVSGQLADPSAVVWATWLLPDQAPEASCFLPPAVMRSAVLRPSPLTRTEALGWAYYMSWSWENRVALATWLGPLARPSRYDLRPLDEVAEADEFVRGSGHRDDWNEPCGAPTLSVAQVTEILRRYLRLAAGHSWPGPTGRSDRAVYEAVCREALTANRPGTRLPFSVRRASELANLAEKTAQRSLNRLVEWGLLRVIRSHRYVEARRFEVRWPFEVQQLPQWLCQETRQPGTQQNTVVIPAPSLVWGRSVLGQTCQRLVECLEHAEPRTDREWYEAAGVPRRTFYQHKQRLVDEQWPLVERNQEGSYRPVPDIQERLAELAERSGAVERHERKVHRHRLESQGHAEYRLWKTGLDESIGYDGSRFVDRTTGEFIRAADVFRPERRERATRAVPRGVVPRPVRWGAPLVPDAPWLPSGPSPEVPVNVGPGRIMAAV
jgi:hypothetical protein